MKKLAMILTLALLALALAAGTALAVAPTEVWVDGELIYDSSRTPALTNTVRNVDYDPDDQTLTLDGARITKGHHYNTEKAFDPGEWYYYHAGVYANGDLKLVLKGSNSIEIEPMEDTTDNGNIFYNITDGIACYRESIRTDLHISGGGSLFIDVSGDGVYIETGDLTIDGCRLDIEAEEEGIYLYEGDLVIDDSELNIEADEWSGIYAWGDIYIDDSIVTVKALGWDGIYARFDIRIRDSYVVAEAAFIGINAEEDIYIENSYIYAEGNDAGMISNCNDPDHPGIEYDGVVIRQGGQVAEIYGKQTIDHDFDDDDEETPDGPGPESTAGAFVDLSAKTLSLGENVLPEQSEEVIENTLLGYTFAKKSRISGEREDTVFDSKGSSYSMIFDIPEASEVVEMVTYEEMTSLFIPLLSGVGKNFPFLDVVVNHWAYNDIFDAFKQGLINGKTPITFEPDGPLTYAEAIKLAACINQLHSMNAVSFEPPAPGQPWYQPYVDYAERMLIIGVGQYADKYRQPITRSDFAVIFAQTLPEEAYGALKAAPNIPDVSPAHPAYASIIKLYQAGIFVGYGADGKFNGSSYIKRSEVATIVMRMVDTERRVIN